MMSKRKRTVISEYEKYVLMELIDAYKDVIENKKNDMETIAKKHLAWKALSNKFNEQSGVQWKTTGQLKNLWKNLKRLAKKAYVEEVGEGDHSPVFLSKPPQEAKMLKKIHSILPEMFETTEFASLNNMLDPSESSVSADARDNKTTSYRLSSEVVCCDDQYGERHPYLTHTPDEVICNIKVEPSDNSEDSIRIEDEIYEPDLPEQPHISSAAAATQRVSGAARIMQKQPASTAELPNDNNSIVRDKILLANISSSSSGVSKDDALIQLARIEHIKKMSLMRLQEEQMKEQHEFQMELLRKQVDLHNLKCKLLDMKVKQVEYSNQLHRYEQGMNETIG